jgi:ABC-type uncharacterized transport system substrate-binding protein
MAISQQMVEGSLVSSFTTPGPNLFGLKSQRFEQTSARVEWLTEALPQVTRVALLFNPFRHGHLRLSSTFEAEARAFGLTIPTSCSSRRPR